MSQTRDPSRNRTIITLTGAEIERVSVDADSNVAVNVGSGSPTITLSMTDTGVTERTIVADEAFFSNIRNMQFSQNQGNSVIYIDEQISVVRDV